MNQMVELKAGQWWADPESVDHRRCKILSVDGDVIQYFDVYATGHAEKSIASKHQWEFDAERGKLILTTNPDWKGLDESQSD